MAGYRDWVLVAAASSDGDLKHRRDSFAEVSDSASQLQLTGLKGDLVSPEAHPRSRFSAGRCRDRRTLAISLLIKAFYLPRDSRPPQWNELG